MTIIGAGGGGKGGGGSSRTPKTAKDSLDSRQYANVIDLISEGEIEGLADGFESIFLNNTPLQNPDGSFNFEDVEIYTRNGTQSQEQIPFTPSVEDEKPVGLTVRKDVPVVRTITDLNVDAVRVTIGIPQLQKIKRKTGDIKGTSVELEISVQYTGGGFTTVVEDLISGRTGDEYKKDYLIELNRPNPGDIVDIRVTRITDDSESPLLLSNDFTWSSYTEIIWAKLTYPNSALVGIRLDAEQFNSIPTRSYLVKGVKVRIPTGVTVDQDTGRIIYPENYIWNGTFSAAVWTSCPAWILWDLLTSSRYGFGDHIDTSQLDKWAFFAASKYSNELVDDGFGGQEARFSCNTTIQTSEDAYKVVNDLLSVMRCQGFWSVGSFTIAQDRPSDPVYLFNQSNVSAEGFNYSGSSLKARPNVAVVGYLDLTLRDTAYEVVEDAEAIDKYGAIRTEISAFACTSRGQASRIGKWLIFSERYEKEVCSFNSSLEAGQQVRPGQIILISDPMKAGSRRAGRIAAAGTQAIVVDDSTDTDLGFETGSLLHVMLPDGRVETREVLTVEDATITVSTPFSITPAANSLWILESPGLQASTWRIISVQEQEGVGYSITAVSHNESKYDYIENGEQLQFRDISNLNDIPSPPSDLRVLDLPQLSGATLKEVQYELNGRIAVKITFGWLAPSGIKNFRVRYRGEDDNFRTVTVQGNTFDIEDISPGVYEIQVSSISASGTLFSEPAIASYTAQGLNAAPLDVSGLSLVPLSENLALLTWNESDELDVRVGGKVIIRHDPRGIDTAEWEATTKIVDSVVGSATQKQVPLLPGTYFVKFEDYLGNRSVNATGVEAKLPQYESRLVIDLVQWEEENLVPPFSGTAVNASYDIAETALVLNLDPYVAHDYWSDVYVEGDMDAEYYFDETLDMGTVYDVNFRRYVRIRPVSLNLPFDSIPGEFDSYTGYFDGTSIEAVNAVTYIRATNDDPSGSPVWGPWSEMINCVVQGRAFQIKCLFGTNSEAVSVAVEELRVIPELTRRVTSSNSSITSSSVSFSPAFYEARSLNITPVDLQTTERYVLSNFDRDGFDITFYSGATVITKSYYYTATGYGRVV